MRRAAIVIAVLASLAALPAATAHRNAAAAGTVVNVAVNAQLKASILVDSRGRTLYLFETDYHGQTACTNDPTFHCSKAWPPLMTTGAPRAGKGVNAKLLGTSKRPEGGLQVTYGGHLLYTDAGSKALDLVADTKPGDVNGQGYLRLWYAVSPKGKPVE